MGWWENLRRAFAAPSGAGDDTYWVHARCRRCGEPLRGRVNLRSEPSLTDEGNWIVRKGLIGSGAKRCFQTVEVTLIFDADKRKVLEGVAVGGELISEEEYRRLSEQPPAGQLS